MGIYDGKTALVTGGSIGLGRETALQFARGGAQVMIADRRVDEGHDTVSTIKEAGGQASLVETDVRYAPQVENMVRATVEHFGGLDYAINNAGISGGLGKIIEQPEKDYDETMDNNVRSMWLCLKYEIAAMLERGGGSIVNVASLTGLVSYPESALYTASKHAVIGFTKTAALEYVKNGIRVNAIAPAAMDTNGFREFTNHDPEQQRILSEYHPIGRISQPGEIASCIVYLCSPGASFITGSTFVLDGGITAQ